MTSIKLIATDLDGTLVGSDSEFGIYPDYRERLQDYRRVTGTEWVVCTGRSLRGFEKLAAPLRTMGLSPQYVIVHHAYIYRLSCRGRYWPHWRWNAGIRFHVWADTLYLRAALNEWQRFVHSMFDGVTTIYHRRNRLCLRFRNEVDAKAAMEFLQRKAGEFKHLRVFQYILEVDVRCVPFTKGMSLEELASRLHLKPSEVLAIGNGHNDISMFDPAAAAHTGCPANAEMDVMEVVHEAGGHVARRRGMAGVVEVLDAYRDGTVDSSLPEWWVPISQQKNPMTVGRRINHPPRRGKIHSSRVALCLGLLIVYTVLLVFASFDLLPFSGWVMWPFVWVGHGIEWFMRMMVR